MKKFISLFILGSTLALTACGDSYTSTITNGNKYSCSSNKALKSCKTDSSCKANKCELIKQMTKTADTKTAETKTTKACDVNGTVITGVSGSCLFKDDTQNANMVITCNDGGMVLDGNIGGFISQSSSYTSSGVNINDYKLQCS